MSGAAGVPRIALAAALAIAAPPVLSVFGAGEVGGWRMFTRIVRVELSITAIDADAPRAIDPAVLAPYLGPDARRVIVAAARGGIGEVSTDSLEAALPALAELVCALERPERVELSLRTSTPEGAPLGAHTEEHPCAP
jgi:hypothetical protein